MKITTDIQPRRDGTVIAVTPDGTEYVLKTDRSGVLVADVEIDEHVGFLLDSGNFHPLEEADIAKGLEVVSLAGDAPVPVAEAAAAAGPVEPAATSPVPPAATAGKAKKK